MFTVKGTLSAHLRSHEGIKSFVCQVCNKLFSTPQSLKVHLRLHTGSFPYQCNLCEKKFRTSGHLKSHQMTHQRQAKAQASNLPSSSHDKSGKKKAIDSALLNIIQLQGPIMVISSNESGKKKSNATLADTDTTQLQSPPQLMGQLTQSTTTIIPETDVDQSNRKYKCSFCVKAFKKSSHLSQHIRSHTGLVTFYYS